MLDFLFGRMFYTDLLIAGFFITAKLPRRSRFPLRVLAAVAGCVLFSYGWSAVFNHLAGHSLWITVINYLGSFTVVLAALCLCVNIRGWSMMFVGAAVWFVQHLASDLDQLLLPHTGGMSLETYFSHAAVMLAVAAGAWLLFFRKLDYHVLGRIDLRSAGPIWVVMCLVCLVIGYYADAAGENSTSFTLMDLLCTAVGLLYQNSLYRYCGVDRERESIDALLRQSRRQYELAKDNMDAVNIKCHDLRHQLGHFRREGRVDESVISEMERVVDAYDTTVKTGCETLDVILTEKSAACAGKGIGFTCMAEGAGLACLEPGDLYALFGNALENAIEATEQLRDPAKKQISLTIRRVKDFSSIHLQNYAAGPLVLVDGLPLTSKTDKESHGFGLKSIKLLVEKYGGEMDFRQEEDVVELCILLPCASGAKK